MLELVLCDDDKFTLELSAEMIADCIAQNKFEANIACQTQNTSEVIRFLEKNKGNYLYFLDLDFGKHQLNGVDVAKKIKAIAPLSMIVFVTSHTDTGLKILKSGVEAFGFIEKSTNRAELLLAYRKYIALAIQRNSAAEPVSETAEDFVKLPVGIDEYVTIPTSQILYVTSAKTISHFVSYHTVDGSSISVRDTIEHILQTLGDDFIKSHRSVIVNKNYVVAVADGLVKFANGETVECSLRLKREIQKLCKAGENT